MYKKISQKGFSSLILVILLVVLVGLGIYLYMVWKTATENPIPIDMGGESGVVEKSGGEEFSSIPESDSTPDEINNETLEELDSLMQSVTDDEEEDLSDLDF